MIVTTYITSNIYASFPWLVVIYVRISSIGAVVL
jgi:hypothetical protein